MGLTSWAYYNQNLFSRKSWPEKKTKKVNNRVWWVRKSSLFSLCRSVFKFWIRKIFTFYHGNPLSRFNFVFNFVLHILILQFFFQFLKGCKSDRESHPWFVVPYTLRFHTRNRSHLNRFFLHVSSDLILVRFRFLRFWILTEFAWI